MLFRVGVRDLMILCAFGAIWGGIWASFLGCMAWRIPRGVSLSQRSYCPSCGHKLSLVDLVPAFSWILLGGKCRYCGTKIPAYHVITEIAFAIISVLCLLQYGITVIMLRNWLFLCCLFCIALAYWDSGTVLGGCLGMGGIIWVGALPFMGMPVREAVVVFLQCVILGAFGVPFFRLLVPLFDFSPHNDEGYPTDCAALLFVTALYLGPLLAIFALSLSCLLLFLFRTRAKRDAKVPRGSMGAMLAVTSAVILILGI